MQLKSVLKLTFIRLFWIQIFRLEGSNNGGLRSSGMYKILKLFKNTFKSHLIIRLKIECWLNNINLRETCVTLTLVRVSLAGKYLSLKRLKIEEFWKCEIYLNWTNVLRSRDSLLNFFQHVSSEHMSSSYIDEGEIWRHVRRKMKMILNIRWIKWKLSWNYTLLRKKKN